MQKWSGSKNKNDHDRNCRRMYVLSDTKRNNDGNNCHYRREQCVKIRFCPYKGNR